jgi:hypothetical protein
MILRAGTFTLAAAGADYCNFVQYLVNWILLQGAQGWRFRQKKTRGKPRVFELCYSARGNYQVAFSVYLPLVEPVPPL